jgi:hypothetical protein
MCFFRRPAAVGAATDRYRNPGKIDVCTLIAATLAAP